MSRVSILTKKDLTGAALMGVYAGVASAIQDSSSEMASRLIKGGAQDGQEVFGHDRADTGPDAAEAVPSGRRELKPVGEPLQAGGFARSNDAMVVWMKWPHCLKTATIGARAGAESWTESVWVKAMGLRYAVTGSRRNLGVPAANLAGVSGWQESGYPAVSTERLEGLGVPDTGGHMAV